MKPLLPILLVAMYALWSGTLFAGATSAGAAASYLGFLAVLWMSGAEWDPLRLGRIGRWLPAVLVAVVLVSMLASRVPRAGWVGVLLLPLWLALPSALAAFWRRRGDLRRTLIATTVLGAAVAAWALIDWGIAGTARPAMPLGHHNLVAAWLAIMVPPMALTAWRLRGAGRWLAGLAVALAVLAIGCSRSLGGAVALMVEGAFLAWLWPPARRWVGLGGALVVAGQASRIWSIVTRSDPSTSVRSTYLEAALRSLAESPWLGQGPGSVGWTSARFLRPIPGVSPPSEVVGQLHAVPLDLLYEVGAVGLLAAAAVVCWFFVARWRELGRFALQGRAVQDRSLALAGLAGLAGGLVTALGNGWLRILALPAALCFCAALALAGARADDVGAVPEVRVGRGRRWPARLYLMAAFLVLLPIVAAQHYYDRATQAETNEAARAPLRRAVWLDRFFPLYRARLAAYTEDPSAAAKLARDAAGSTVGSPALWLNAGALERAAGLDSAASLRRALELDPLAAYAPFELALATDSPDCAARALLAEPRLAAALAFDERHDLLEGAAARIAAWEGIDLGWREEMVSRLRRQASRTRRRAGVGSGLAASDLASPHLATAHLVFGGESPESFGLSLYGFRRRPWGAGWLRVRVRSEAASALDLPPATRLATSTSQAFPRNRCAP